MLGIEKVRKRIEKLTSSVKILDVIYIVYVSAIEILFQNASFSLADFDNFLLSFSNFSNTLLHDLFSSLFCGHCMFHTGN